MSEDERNAFIDGEREAVSSGGDDVEGHLLDAGAAEREALPLDDDSERRLLPDGN